VTHNGWWSWLLRVSTVFHTDEACQDG